MPQAASKRGDDEADLVADAAGAVLVDFFPGNSIQDDAIARSQHDPGQVGQLAVVQAADVNGHQPGCDLVVGDVAADITGDDESDLLPVQFLAIPFLEMISYMPFAIFHRIKGSKKPWLMQISGMALLKFPTRVDFGPELHRIGAWKRTPFSMYSSK